MIYRCVKCGDKLLLEFRRSGFSKGYIPHLRCKTCKKIVYFKKK